MAVLDLTQSNFDETIANNEIVIIDFWAPWCGPCLQFAPTFKETSEKVEQLKLQNVGLLSFSENLNIWQKTISLREEI